MKSKKIIAIFTIFLLLVSFIPTTIFACPTPDPTPVTVDVKIYQKDGGHNDYIKTYTLNITQSQSDALQPLSNIPLTTKLYNDYDVLADLFAAPITASDVVSNGWIYYQWVGYYNYKSYYKVEIVLKNGTLDSTIKFVAGTGGYFAPGDQTIFNDIEYNTKWKDAVDVPTPVANSGYTFNSWSPSLPSEHSKITEDVTYTATFTAIKYDITYYLNSGTNDTENPSKYTVEDTVSIQDPSRYGYTFAGWYEDAAYTTPATTSFGPGVTGAKTFYAKWEKDSSFWSDIEFTTDGHGTLSGTTLFQDILDGTLWGDVITVPGFTPDTGYEGGTWSPSIPSNDTAVTENQTYTVNFTAIDYNITYYLNSGTNDTENPSKYTVEDTISIQDPSRYGYTFAGWYEDAAYTTPATTSFGPGVTGAKTFYAKWEKDSSLWYSITFAAGANGTLSGTTSFDDILNGTLWGTAITAVPTPVADSGYVFDYWSPAIPADDTAITASATYTAVFAEDENDNDIPDYREYHDVTFTAGTNGSLSGTSSFEDILYGTEWDSAIAAVPTPVADSGYAFDYWSPAIPAGSSLIKADATYEAVFAEDENDNDIPDYREYHDVTFTAGTNGSLSGTSFFEDILYGTEWDSAITAVPTPVADSGYTFDYWSPTLPDGTSLIKADATYEAIFAVDENDNDIPDYKEDHFTISFEAGTNGTLTGTDEYSDILTGILWGTAITAVPTPVADSGYAFDYWSPAIPADDTAITASVTYTAVFAVDENGNDIPDYREYHDVTFTAGANGSLSGTSSFEDILYGTEWDSAITAVPTPVADSGYTFDYWSPTLPGGTSLIKADATYEAVFAEDENDNDIPDYREYHDVIFTAGANGSLSGTTSYDDILYGTEWDSAIAAVPTPVADSGYAFDYWSPAIPAGSSLIKADATYEAVFAEDENDNDIPDYREYHDVTFTAGTNGSLSGTSSFEDILYGTEWGSAITAVPTPVADSGYTFDYWSPTLPDGTSLIKADATYEAIFAVDENDNDIPDYKEDHFTISFEAGTNGTLTGTDEYSDILTGILWGTAITAVPTPVADSGYAFDYWSPAIPADDTAITASVTYTAVFAVDENGNDIPDYKEPHYTITFTTDGNGSLSGKVVYTDVLTGFSFSQAGITVPATSADSGYTFSRWTYNGATVNLATIVVNKNMTFVADFTANTTSSVTTTTTTTPPTTTIEEEEIPLSPAPEEPTVIEEEPTPLAPGEPVLALVNLICVLITLIGMFYLFGSKDSNREQRERRRKAARFIGFLVAVISAVAFYLTEPLVYNFRWVDSWTILMVAITLVQFIIIGVTNKKEDESEMKQA
jgi:uncharacterized repeat protein (TIGR02543 family)